MGETEQFYHSPERVLQKDVVLETEKERLSKISEEDLVAALTLLRSEAEDEGGEEDEEDNTEEISAKDAKNLLIEELTKRGLLSTQGEPTE